MKIQTHKYKNNILKHLEACRNYVCRSHIEPRGPLRVNVKFMDGPEISFVGKLTSVLCGRAAIFGVYLYNSQKMKDPVAAVAVTNNSTELENQALLVARSASMKEKVS